MSIFLSHLDGRKATHNSGLPKAGLTLQLQPFSLFITFVSCDRSVLFIPRLRQAAKRYFGQR